MSESVCMLQWYYHTIQLSVKERIKCVLSMQLMKKYYFSFSLSFSLPLLSPFCRHYFILFFFLSLLSRVTQLDFFFVFFAVLFICIFFPHFVFSILCSLVAFFLVLIYLSIRFRSTYFVAEKCNQIIFLHSICIRAMISMMISDIGEKCCGAMLPHIGSMSFSKYCGQLNNRLFY